MSRYVEPRVDRGELILDAAAERAGGRGERLVMLVWSMLSRKARR